MVAAEVLATPEEPTMLEVTPLDGKRHRVPRAEVTLLSTRLLVNHQAHLWTLDELLFAGSRFSGVLGDTGHLR
eukprot:CAMPEP_0170502078 /NCGR_PEP_ID=MMETSP0208-20121228/40352_1 /TAXON_ID=197538 /ORGANISM="Strombidium inclinatum, Strain S3" /LENGTH=72 /DNA_ID=CAMNT_0010780951 /DNA_START=1525 /DNA_END=1743 /DNA_ORIENTATION=-